jgi:hypothetical protein
MLYHFLSWHPESVEGVSYPDNNEANEHAYGIAREVTPQARTQEKEISHVLLGFQVCG